MSGWADLVAHARAERNAFKARATAARKDWLEARRTRRGVDALKHKDRETEYRRTAADRQAFIDQHKSLSA